MFKEEECGMRKRGVFEGCYVVGQDKTNHE